MQRNAFLQIKCLHLLSRNTLTCKTLTEENKYVVNDNAEFEIQIQTSRADTMSHRLLLYLPAPASQMGAGRWFMSWLFHF